MAQGAALGDSERVGLPDLAFLFEASLVAAVQIIQTGNGYAGSMPSAVVGVRTGRVQLGIGATLYNLASDGTTGGPMSAFTVGPSIAVDLLRANDRRVAFYGLFGAWIGSTFGVNRSPKLGVFAFGLGVRYAPHPMFAIGFEAGLLDLWAERVQAGRRRSPTAP